MVIMVKDLFVLWEGVRDNVKRVTLSKYLYLWVCCGSVYLGVCGGGDTGNSLLASELVF